MVREKYLENEIFSRSGNFVDGQGKERTWTVREKSGNLKKKPWQAVFRKFILFKMGKDVFSQR